MRITIHLKPNSKHREEVVANDDESLTVYTKSPALENRANASAIKLIAKNLRVPRSQVEIVRGHTSKQKIIEIAE